MKLRPPFLQRAKESVYGALLRVRGWWSLHEDFAVAAASICVLAAIGLAAYAMRENDLIAKGWDVAEAAAGDYAGLVSMVRESVLEEDKRQDSADMRASSDDLKEWVEERLADRTPRVPRGQTERAVTRELTREIIREPSITNVYNTYPTTHTTTTINRGGGGGGNVRVDVDLDEILESTGTLINKTIDATTNLITNLGVTNFALTAVSQFTNDVGYITNNSVDILSNKIISPTLNTIEGLTVANFAVDTLSQFTNDLNLLTATDPLTLTNKTIDAATNTITGLTSANFASDLLSQFTNDLDVLTNDAAGTLTNKVIDAGSNTITGLTKDNFVTDALSQFTNDLGFITENDDILGNAATATSALTSLTADLADEATHALHADEALSSATAGVATLAQSVTDGLYSTGTYLDPSWLTGLDGSKLLGTITANAISAGTYAIAITGNAATATLANVATLADNATHALSADEALTALSATTATLADSVVNGLYSTGNYVDPAWLAGLDGGKLTGTVLANAIESGSYAIDIIGNADTATLAANATSALSAVTAQTADVADEVVNGLYSTGSYLDPSWLSGLDGAKLIGTVTASALASGTYGIDILGNAATATLADVASLADLATLANEATHAVSSDSATEALSALTAASADTADFAMTVLNGVVTTGSYADPSWIANIAGSKLVGTVTANAIESGAYAIDVLGNADTATLADVATLADTATVANSVVNGLYSTGSYVNPSWLSSLDGGKLTGIVEANAIANGEYDIDISGTAAAALSADTAAFADEVLNGVVTTGSYSNPSWITGLAGSKLTGTVTANAIASGTYGIDISGNATTASLASIATIADSVTNGLYSTGSYSNPSWLTGLSWGKLSSLPTTLSGYGITDSVALTTGSYSDPAWITGLAGSKLSGTVTATNGVVTTGSYSNPSWITGLAGSKLTGTVTANAIAAGSYSIDILGNAASVTNGLYSTGSYSNPTWLTGLDGGKLTGTITASALAAGDYAVTNLSASSSLTATSLLGSNTVVASGTLANTALSGTCAVNVNALNLAAFQTSATITTSHVFYNSSRNRHSRIGSVSTCTDGSGNPWRVLSLSDSISSSASGDSYTIYNPTATLGNSSSGFFNNLYAISLRGLASVLSGGFDVAEQYETDDESIGSGDVVSLDPEQPLRIEKSSAPYDARAVGIISTNPGLTLGDEKEGIWRSVALAGRVPVKVSARNGAIKTGDYLTTSDIPGVAVRATKAGAVIGKAMEPYDAEETGLITAFVETGTQNGSRMELTIDHEVESDPAETETGSPLSVRYLNRLMSEQESTTDESNVTSDTILANLRIATPELAANTLYANLIKAAGDGALSFEGDVVFLGRAYWNADTAGFAEIEQGARSVRIEFETPYLELPVLSVLPNVPVAFAVSDRDETGFTIELEDPANETVSLDWIALAVRNAKTFTGNGPAWQHEPVPEDPVPGEAADPEPEPEPALAEPDPQEEAPQEISEPEPEPAPEAPIEPEPIETIT